MLTLGAWERPHRSDRSDQKTPIRWWRRCSPVEWTIPGPPDVRGRQILTLFSPLDAFIEDSAPRLDRWGDSAPNASDNTVLVILDPLAITDEHTFRWGGSPLDALIVTPPHVYKIKAVDGIVQNQETGVRFASEVTVIR